MRWLLLLIALALGCDAPVSELTPLEGRDGTGADVEATDAAMATDFDTASDGLEPIQDAAVGLDGAGLEDTATADVAVPPEACPDDLTFFAQRVRSPILALKCAGCHSADGLASGTDLVLAGPGDANPIEADFAMMTALAQKSLQGVPVLLLKPTGLHPAGHTGGTLIAPGSIDYAALVELTARLRGADPCATAACDSVEPGTRTLRRLTRAEYDRTIESVFGFASTWAAGFTAENVVHGFDNNAAALVVTPLLADQLRDAAEAIAAKAAAQPLPSWLPCAVGDVGCDATFVAAMGRQVLRRPLDAEERARYLALFHAASEEDGFAAGVELTIAAMLQSPHFLYRFELGTKTAEGRYTLSAHEVASELSYLLWGTSPDATLAGHADDGSILDSAVLASETERLLEDPRAEPAVWRFAQQWLGLALLEVLPKDTATYPALTGEIRAAMTTEARDFVAATLLDGKPLSALLTSTARPMPAALASYYGVPPSGDVAGTSYPGGVLGLGAVLTVHAFPAGSSPIHRGKLVRERLFCQDLAPPPPGLIAQIPPVTPGTTTRERFAAHMSVEPCLSCHRLMDPIGFGFEHFDGAGRYRETDGGLPIDDSTQILETAATNGTHAGLGELGAALGNSEDVHACFVRQWLRFGYGVEPDAAMACLEEQLSDDFVSGGGTLPALLTAMVMAPHFRERRDPPPLPTVPDPDPPDVTDGDTVDTADTVDTTLPSPGEIAHTLVIDSQWDAGYCVQATVGNAGDTTVTWSKSWPVDGAITQIWNAISSEVEVDGEAMVLFSGVASNATLAPGEDAKFGYCVSTAAPGGDTGEPAAVSVSQKVDSDWQSGFCHSVEVTNVGAAAGSWTVELTLPGAIQNLWDAQASLIGGTTYRFTGLAYNAQLEPGSTVKFGFCGTK